MLLLVLKFEYCLWHCCQKYKIIPCLKIVVNCISDLQLTFKVYFMDGFTDLEFEGSLAGILAGSACLASNLLMINLTCILPLLRVSVPASCPNRNFWETLF